MTVSYTNLKLKSPPLRIGSSVRRFKRVARERIRVHAAVIRGGGEDETSASSVLFFKKNFFFLFCLYRVFRANKMLCTHTHSRTRNNTTVAQCLYPPFNTVYRLYTQQWRHAINSCILHAWSLVVRVRTHIGTVECLTDPPGLV